MGVAYKLQEGGGVQKRIRYMYTLIIAYILFLNHDPHACMHTPRTTTKQSDNNEVNILK